MGDPGTTPRCLAGEPGPLQGMEAKVFVFSPPSALAHLGRGRVRRQESWRAARGGPRGVRTGGPPPAGAWGRVCWRGAPLHQGGAESLRVTFSRCLCDIPATFM